MKLRLLFLLILLCDGPLLFAQLSTGGQPLRIAQSKLLRADSFQKLEIPKSELELAERLEAENQELKPFHFAYAIPVDLSPSNSGVWVEIGDYRVWQLRLESSGAFSLNVIFDRFHLPEGARLFLFSEDGQDLLGAFTELNNKESGMLAVSPVAGDKLVIQYEEPMDATFHGELHLQSVNHDFKGVKAYSGGRRPLGESGSCNVNVNCDYLDEYREAANGVCRILVNGTELCSGTLVNNVRSNGTPYLITANHCIENISDANSSVFLFNYESPYCGNIDGEILNTISGSTFKAGTADLDFSLVQLSSVPPKSFMPYYLGWDITSSKPDSVVCIHHPQGDIKKVAIDRNSPSQSSFKDGYVSSAFWKVANWEEGTTESGSSGASLIDPKMKLRGILTGGEATCSNPVNDYFSQFRFAWDHYSESDKQLKVWLDPSNSGTSSIVGLDPYAKNETCNLVTNLNDDDQHTSGLIDAADESKGYYAGTNSYGFDAFAESFHFTQACKVQGVSLGLAKMSVQTGSTYLRIAVYSGETQPETELYSKDYSFSGVDEGVMNYFAFDQEVTTDGNFWVVWSLDGLTANDVFAVYLSTRNSSADNTFYISDGGDWYTYGEKSNSTQGAAAVVEAVVCYTPSSSIYDPLVEENLDAVVYPNPVVYGRPVYIRFSSEVDPEAPQMFDLLGRAVPVSYSFTAKDQLTLQFDANRPGIYLVRVRGKANQKEYKFKLNYLGKAE